MMAVRCPACNERVEGSNSQDLSQSIKTHFADIHKMDIDVEMNTSDEGCGCGTESGSKSAESSTPGTRQEFSSGADAQTEGSDKPAGSPTMGRGLAPGGMVDSKEKSFEVGNTANQAGMGKFESGIETPEGTGADEETRGIHMFECPMCREEIKGSNEKEMSSSFREHLTTTHKDEPFVTQLMEKVGERR